jgi:transcriptional regulator of met regulon
MRCLTQDRLRDELKVMRCLTQDRLRDELKIMRCLTQDRLRGELKIMRCLTQDRLRDELKIMRCLTHDRLRDKLKNFRIRRQETEPVTLKFIRLKTVTLEAGPTDTDRIGLPPTYPVALQSLKDLGRITHGKFLKVFRHLVGLLRRGPSQGLLPTQDSTTQKDTDKHP